MGMSLEMQTTFCQREASFILHIFSNAKLENSAKNRLKYHVLAKFVSIFIDHGFRLKSAMPTI